MNLLKKTLKLFSSVRLAVILFLSLAATTLIGSCLPQEPLVGREALIERYSDNLELIQFFSLHDVFHSWWFLLLFFLLSINLTVASFKRVFPSSRKAILWPNFLRTIQNQPKAQFTAELAGSNWKQIKDTLKTQGWEFKEQNHSLIARKGAFHRLGPSITHVGILTILFGALISLLFGFNGVIQGVQGDQFVITENENALRSYILVQTSKVFHSPLWLGKVPKFEVELGKTTREDYKSGQPKQWSTELTFHAGQKLAKIPSGLVRNKQIVSVNNPVNFQGVDFYQADWKRVLQVVFNGQKFELNLDKIQGSEVAFISVTPELGLLFFLPAKLQGQLLLISVKGSTHSTNLAELTNLQKLFNSGNLKILAQLSPSEQASVGPMSFKYVGAFSKTGIQYKSSGGDPIMILGMAILILGVLISFGNKRTLWIIQPENTEKVILLANSDRSKDLFTKEFDDLVFRLQNCMKMKMDDALDKKSN